MANSNLTFRKGEIIALSKRKRLCYYKCIMHDKRMAIFAPCNRTGFRVKYRNMMAYPQLMNSGMENINRNLKPKKS